MTLAYFDAAAGASGDMILGALVDAGLPFEALRDSLAGLAVEGYALRCERVMRRGVVATKLHVELLDTPAPHARHLRHIVELLDNSELPPEVRAKALSVFQRLAEAEAKVHGTTPERIHFHEVGAVDAIVDIVGACWGLALLGVERVVCSPLPVSHGWVECEHGRLPVPAWATQELLRGVPTVPLDLEGETLTPTGAALLTTLADGFGRPAMTARGIGYGAGTKDFGVPNVLRLVLGEPAETASAVVVVEANLDDMNPEWYELAVERIFAAGAVDVTLQPIQMKKSRPAVLLRAVTEPERRAAVCDAILRETTTLGVRYYPAARECLERTWLTVTTPYGEVRVKVGRRQRAIAHLAPEYEECRACAVAHQAPLAAVYTAAQSAALALLDETEAGWRKAT
jgi:uncharacterized protein (TIGR00299 family) protein